MQYETLQKILDKMDLNRTAKQIEQQRYLRISVRDNQDDENINDKDTDAMYMFHIDDRLRRALINFKRKCEEKLTN